MHSKIQTNQSKKNKKIKEKLKNRIKGEWSKVTNRVVHR